MRVVRVSKTVVNWVGTIGSVAAPTSTGRSLRTWILHAVRLRVWRFLHIIRRLLTIIMPLVKEFMLVGGLTRSLIQSQYSILALLRGWKIQREYKSHERQVKLIQAAVRRRLARKVVSKLRLKQAQAKAKARLQTKTETMTVAT